MNLVDSMKYVLKERGQDIVSDFLKDDFKSLLTDLASEITTFRRDKSKKKTIAATLFGLKDSASSTFSNIKDAPHRLVKGLLTFKDDYLEEVDKIPEAKDKVIFTFKVLTSISGFLLEAFYGFNKARGRNIWEFKRKSNLTHIFTSIFIFKLGQALLSKFLTEVEKHMTDEEELKRLQFFKKVIHDQNQEIELEEPSAEDPAFVIVDKLRNYILHG